MYSMWFSLALSVIPLTIQEPGLEILIARGIGAGHHEVLRIWSVDSAVTVLDRASVRRSVARLGTTVDENELGRALGSKFRMGSYSSAVVCERVSGNSRCSVRGADHVVTVDSIRVDGTRAIIGVTFHRPGTLRPSGSRGMSGVEFLVELESDSTVWRAVRSTIGRMT